MTARAHDHAVLKRRLTPKIVLNDVVVLNSAADDLLTAPAFADPAAPLPGRELDLFGKLLPQSPILLTSAIWKLSEWRGRIRTATPLRRS